MDPPPVEPRSDPEDLDDGFRSIDDLCRDARLLQSFGEQKGNMFTVPHIKFNFGQVCRMPKR